MNSTASAILRKHYLRDVVAIAFGLMLIVLMVGGGLGYVNAWRLADNNQKTVHTYEVIGGLETLLSNLKDAEAGQRGYLLTEDEQYLPAYNDAVKRTQAEVARLKELTSDNSKQRDRLAALDQKVARRLDELQQAVTLMKKGDRSAALEVVGNNPSSTRLDDVRQDVVAMQQAERDLLQQWADEAKTSYLTTVLSILLTAIVGIVLIGVIFYLSQRNSAQRQRAAEILSEQRERLRITLASIGDAVITTDAKGNVAYLNAVAQDLTGWTQDDANGKALTTVFNVINEQTRQPVENPVAKVLKLGQVVGLANHTVLIRKDGSERPIDDSAAPIRDDKSGIIGVVLVFRDIMERWRTERAMAEQIRLTALRADTTAALISTEEPQVALQRCAEILVQQLDVAFARVWILNEVDNVLELQASAGQYTHLDGPHSRIKVGEFKIGRIASSRQPHLTNAVPDDPYISDREWARREGMVAFAGHPLMANGRVLGVVAMFARRPLSNAILADLVPLADSLGQYLDRRRTEVALRESEARKTAMFVTALDCIITCDHEGKIIEFNPAAERTFGYRRDAVVNRVMSEIIIPPALRQRHQQGMARFMNTRQSRILGQRLLLTGLRADGSEFPLELSVTQIPTGGQPVFTAYLRDISDRQQAEEALRRSEERFRGIFNQTLAGIAEVDLTGRFIRVNKRYCEMADRSQDALYDLRIQDITYPEDFQRNAPLFEQAVTQRTPFVVETRYVRPDGSLIWISNSVSPLRGHQEEIKSLTIACLDITEQKRLENELRNIAAELSEADRRKTEFLATLGHELRNPLAPIRTGLEIMKMAKNDPTTIEEIRSTMERQAQQMVRLIDDLLDVSRITQGKLELRTCRVALADVVQSAVEATRPFIDESGHELTVTMPSQPILLDADPNRLAQVFSNLLNNSTKYTPEGGHIWLTAERQGSEVRVTVKDNGVGIPANMQDGIFEMFTQIDRPLEKGYKGLGIGLTLVKRLVELHGGRIEVYSAGADQGSEFKVRLPILFESLVAEPQLAQNETAPPATKLRILVVDDNLDAATMLGMIVRALGNEVRTAHDGLHAVEVAADFQPDVVLMDLGMPKMNGYEAARHIRKQAWGKNMVLVALTGWGQDEDKQRTKEAGFDHHLVKPAEPAALQKLLAELETRAA